MACAFFRETYFMLEKMLENKISELYIDKTVSEI